MTGQEALRAALPRLQAAGVESAALDARWLLAAALEISRDRLTLMLPDALTADQEARFEALITARCQRQPVAQLTGQRDFYGRTFKVTSDVLDPRPETELLVDVALKRPFASILDLGTGSGCILISLLAENATATGLGIDISAPALRIAQENATALNVANRLHFHLSNWFHAVSGVFDLIVSNPPYIAAAELPNLAPEVRDWEPLQALSPGEDGLAVYRLLAQHTSPYLTPGGRLIVETGASQAQDVADLFSAAGFFSIEIADDLAGHGRVVSAQSPE